MSRNTIPVLGCPIDAVEWADARARIGRWAAAHESRYVCLSNVHSVVLANREQGFGRALRLADMATPDGAPVAWAMRRFGAPAQRRICGPDLMLALCDDAAEAGLPVFLYGSTQATLERLRDNLLRRFPRLRIAGLVSPPFRPLSDAEEDAIVARINDSGAALVFVGLGCPKQELWMQRHRGRIHAVMLGVGAAFDFHAGTLARAPRWMQRCGLEWLHRLASEPRRLWKRYLVTNSRFIAGILWQFLRGGGEANGRSARR